MEQVSVLENTAASIPAPSPAPSPARRAGRREWISLGVIALPCLLYAMDLTVLDLAVPRLSADLKPTGAQLLWIVDIYGFVLAGLLIPMGTLGDRIGRRKLLLVGSAAFGIASIFAAFARNAEMLIAARAVLGVAGATLAPSTLSLIRNMFLDENQRTRAIGIWIASYSAGGAIGPIVGGALLNHFWWGSVFLIGVPVMLLLLVVGPALLPEFRDPSARRIDMTSAALSLLAVLLVIYGVKRMTLANTYEWPAVTIVAGLVCGAIFVHRQRTLANPLLDLALFRNAKLSAALVAYTITTLVAFGIYLFLTQYLQVVKGLSPLAAGVVMLPIFAGFISGALFGPPLARRIRPVTVMVGGLLISAVGFALFAIATPSTPVVVIAIGAAIYSLGLSPVFTLSTDLVVGAAPVERAGAASALSETGSELGGALGIALLGSVGTAVYRSAMMRTTPSSVSADAADIARNTVGGAIAVADKLSGNVGPALSNAARVAFTQSLNATSWICVAVVLTTALGLWIALRRT